MPRRAVIEEPVPLGAPLAPPPDDLDVMMSIEQPLEELKPFDAIAESLEGGSGRLMAEMTRPDAMDTKRGIRGVSHVGPPQRTLYSISGDSRSVMHSDVPMLVDQSLPAAVRLYIRCPKCWNVPPTNGFHRASGMNQCPGKAKKLWSACPICRNHGREHRVFEDEAFEHTPRDLDVDENYVQPQMPDNVTRQQRLLEKLNLHMCTFHAGEAYQLFGLRRKSINSGQAFLAEHSAGITMADEE